MTEIYKNRRTFAIISHPDAGKTTLTEKLLLGGGAINMAGEVKARGDRRRARSDWLAIEQKRGISVTTSAMTFEKDGTVFNLLDTPGHEDFSEDTYRTLTAVDSAIMVVDAAKGIEAQTLKLFEVCRLRDIPIITFINKVDREGNDPFELLDEISDKLALDCVPMVWPAGLGGQFKGTIDLHHNQVLMPGENNSSFGRREDITGLDDPRLAELIGDEIIDDVAESAELARDGYPAFDLENFRAGAQTPVYFGSALREFSVNELLRDIAAYAPPPRPQQELNREVRPEEENVSGFVFKVQANMDPNHRDRIAFVRLCSGEFKRGMKLKNTRSQKPLAINNPIFFLAQDRHLAETAVAGDVMGIPNHGALNVGDTLSQNEALQFAGLPDFAPEIIRRVRLDDPMKSKQMRRAITALAEEGASQMFEPEMGADIYVGVVGALQLDVIEERLKAEYGVKAALEVCGLDTVRWVISDDPAEMKKFAAQNRKAMGTDRYGATVFMASSAWEADYAERTWGEKITFLRTRERT